MLGFEKPILQVMLKVIIRMIILMDKSDGINFMYVYCDEIEPVLFGKETRNWLLVCPIP